MSSTSLQSTAQTDSITGEYLFDGRHFDAVFYTIIYEEDGKLLALSELADYPVEMEQRESSPPVYRIKFRSAGDFNLSFSQLEDGRYNTLTMKSNTSEFEMDGHRDDNAICKLRREPAKPGNGYRYREPLNIGDGLETGSVYDTGIDTTGLFGMMNDVLENYSYIHSILVIKDGRLVVEDYFNGWDPVRLHRLQSVTKSVTSTLVGLALEQGLIEKVNDPIYKYMPQYDSLLTGDKRSILIEHLLTMSAGFEWNEAATYFADPKNCDAHIALASGDCIGYVLRKPLLTTPGGTYYYNSGYPNMLGHIIVARSGLRLLEFALTNLFEPLGIHRAYWNREHMEKQYRPGCAGGLRLTSRDMAKYGLLYLNDGVWKGTQVIGRDWVRASIEGIMDSGNNTRYGYLWKRTWSLDGKHEIFFASGTGGQYIVCLPGLDAVVVTTAVFKTDKGDELAMLLLKQLLPALAGS